MIKVEDSSFSSDEKYPRDDHLMNAKAVNNSYTVAVPLEVTLSPKDGLENVFCRNGISTESKQKCASLIHLLEKCDMMKPDLHRKAYELRKYHGVKSIPEDRSAEEPTNESS